MAWGTPSLLSSGNISSAHSFNLTSVTAASGVLVVVSGAFRSAALNDAIIISDSASNTWTVHTYYPVASVFGAFIAWAYITSPLSSGTITVADTTTGTKNFTFCNAYAYGVTGASASSTEDVSVFATGGGGTSPNIALTSGTASQAGDLLFSAVATNMSTAIYTEDAAWTNLVNQQGNSNTLVNVADFINSGSSAVMHTPTLNTTSSAYAHIIVGFLVVAGTSISGSAAWTEISDSLVAAGSVDIGASAAWTEASDALSASGTVIASQISGTAAWSEAQDIWTGAGSITLPAISGAASWSEINDLWNGQGSSGSQEGHFLPLTEKQKREFQKQMRRERKASEGRIVARRLDAENISNDIKDALKAKPLIEAASINNIYDDVEDDDDIEFLLLYG